MKANQVLQTDVQNVVGVKGIVEKKDIELALLRNWSIHNENIKVEVSGAKVTLTGSVSSLKQKDVAGKIAQHVPGVWTVNNKLIIEYNYSLSI